MMMKYVLFLLLASAANLYGQGFERVPSQYYIEPLHFQGSLYAGYFNDAVEDNEGYIWISGTKGVDVFDGQFMVHYDLNSPLLRKNSAEGANLFRMIKGPDGNIYIENFTAGHLIVIDPYLRKYKGIINSTHPGKVVGSLSISKDNQISLLLHNQERTLSYIQNWNKNRRAAEVTAIELAPTRGPTFWVHVAGFNWLIKNKKIIKFSVDGVHLKSYQYPGKQLDAGALYFTDSTFYVLDIAGRNIYRYNPLSDKMEHYLRIPVNLSGTGVKLIVKDEHIIIASSTLLLIFDKERKTFQDLSVEYIRDIKKYEPNGVGLNLSSLLLTKRGDIIFVRQKRLYRLKKKLAPIDNFRVPLKIYPPPPNLASIRAIAEDEQHNIYATYYNNGIAKKNAGAETFITMPATERLKKQQPGTYSLNYWKGKLLWNNTVLDLKTNQLSFIAEKYYAGHVTQFLDKDTLWLYPWFSNKIYKHDLVNNVTINYELSRILGETFNSIEEISDITSSQHGTSIWLATKTEGLLQMSKQGQLIRKYGSRELGIKESKICEVSDLQFIKDTLWYGTSEGLGCIDTRSGKRRFYPLTIINKHGQLQERFVFSILPGNTGNLYLGTDEGLYLFRIPQEQYVELKKGHPLANIEFNRNATHKSANGRYYFGSIDGLFTFLPSELDFRPNTTIQKEIKIYNVSIVNRQSKRNRLIDSVMFYDKPLILHPDDEQISIQFSYPDFEAITYYSYVINGKSETWTDFNKDNKINIYQLAPGTYTLKIKAWSGLNQESKNVIKLSLVKEQVWYKRTWVRLLFLLFALLLSILIVRRIYRQRLKRQFELARLRTKISADLHDDVGALLAGIAMQSQLLISDVETRHKESLKEISTMSRDAMESMRDIVWAIDSRKDKYEDLVTRMSTYAERMLYSKNIGYSFNFDGIDQKMFISPEKRQNIYLIFKEAITNIVKHSDSDQVTVVLNKEREQLTMMISDNGSTPGKIDSSGSGIENMKMRAAAMGWTLETYYDKGFIVKLYSPS